MISLCPLTVLPCSVSEQIDAALETGYNAIGLRVTQTLATDLDIIGDEPLRVAIAKRIRESGLDVLDTEVVRISPKTDVPALEPLLRYAGEVGSRSIAITGEVKADWVGEWGPEQDEAVVRNLRALCDAAAAHGVVCALEFMIYRSIDTLGNALSLREKVAHPNLKVTVDALHFARAGCDINELAAVDPEAISCFQICDAAGQAPDNLPHEARYGRLLPGTGALPLVDIVRALPKDVPIGVEVPDASQAGKSVVERARTAAEATRRILESAGRDWK